MVIFINLLGIFGRVAAWVDLLKPRALRGSSGPTVRLLPVGSPTLPEPFGVQPTKSASKS